MRLTLPLVIYIFAMPTFAAAESVTLDFEFGFGSDRTDELREAREQGLEIDDPDYLLWGADPDTLNIGVSAMYPIAGIPAISGYLFDAVSVDVPKASLAQKLLDCTVTPIITTRFDGDVPCQDLDPRDASRHMSWTPTVPLRKVIATSVDGSEAVHVIYLDAYPSVPERQVDLSGLCGMSDVEKIRFTFGSPVSMAFTPTFLEEHDLWVYCIDGGCGWISHDNLVVNVTPLAGQVAVPLPMSGALLGGCSARRRL